MYYRLILSTFNTKTILVLIPRAVSIFFIIFQGLGMMLYPGGTIHDLSTTGYSFTLNFFSDMGAYEARNGEPNYLSMIFFSISLILVGVTFALYYFALPKVFGNNNRNYYLSWIGTIFAFGGSICLIGTGLTPTDLVFDSHVFFANNIFYSFLVTSFFYSIVIFDINILEKRYAIGYVVFFISILLYVGVLQFGPSVNTGQSELIFQVVAQKLIVIIFFLTVIHQTFGLRKLKID
ncbi:MAG: hypothetical protein CBE24_02445 [bacterium TMED264]|nr:MAG: hypothetical protein CBE24_02445 [bacterium TMED264]|tara:strand:- start:354 stop:1058 length:705 start_codon:yes stop_codon:yes gene_type:complete